MATTVSPPTRGTTTHTVSPRRRGPVSWLREHVIQILAGFALVYMFMPIAIVVLFSFNDPVGRFNYQWTKFSLNAWLHPCAVAGMCDSVRLSLVIGFVATLVATILGTLVAFALARHAFAGRGGTNLLIFMPMATPEVVMGSSLLALFVNFAVIPLGFWTIVIAHIMFCISFVIVTVKARVAGLDPRLEQAAMDLYADERTAFWKVTFPLVLPGIVAAGLLAFSLSFDDYIITNFNSGSSVTFPMFVWGAAQRGTPVQINVIGTAMFLIALLLVVSGRLFRRRRNSD